MNKESKTKYLEPEVVSSLSNLSLVARLVVEGFIVGLHKSPYHGFSVEFAEHKPYMPGDDIKNIDWKVYARTDRYYIKKFEEETNLKSYILLDKSGSMGYASENLTKLSYSKYLAASLSYLMLQQQDAISLTTFSNAIDEFYPPIAKRSQLKRILGELNNTMAEGQGDIANMLHTQAEKIKKRSLIIVISDLLEEPNGIIKGLKHLRHYDHEIIVLHVLDEQEQEFEFDSQTKFVDMEGEGEIETEPWHVRKDYTQLIKKHIQYLQKECRNNNIDYVNLTTNKNLGLALTEYLKKRKKIG